MKFKLVIVLVLITYLIFIITACDTSDDGSIEQSLSEQHAEANAQLLGANRYYSVEQINLDLGIDFIQYNIFLHQNELHLLALEVDNSTLNSYIHLMHMDADGTNIKTIYRTLLNADIDFFNIIGFKMHENGYVSLVTTDNGVEPPYTREDVFDGLRSFDIRYSYMYRNVSPNGEITSALSIDALNHEKRQLSILEIAFDTDGNAVVLVNWFPEDFELPPFGGMIAEDIGGLSFFLFNNGITSDFVEIESLAFSRGLYNRSSDNSIIIPSYTWHNDEEAATMYEVDFNNVEIIEELIIKAENPVESIDGVFPSPIVSVFDFYVLGNNHELFGYSKSDGSFTQLFDFLNQGVPLGQAGIEKSNFLLWEDGRKTIVDIGWNPSLGKEELTLYHLTPNDGLLSQRLETERDVITLGGIDVNMTPLMEQVATFNRQSETHRVEVVNYTYDDMERLRVELLAGRGPDIFLLSWWGAELVEALSESHFILDLYQKIDDDPILSRSDFFQTVLSAWENSRGELVQIAPNFSIQTVVGKQSVFPEAPADWNYADFIDFYKGAQEGGVEYPLGQVTDRLRILTLLLFSDDSFFCGKTGVASFDSKSFIDVLNFTMSLPDDLGWGRISNQAVVEDWDPVADLIRGEQLLLPFEFISNMVSFRVLGTRLDGFTAFGFPTNSTPAHAVLDSSGTSLGIRANSKHVGAAWEFVRLSLLPSAPHDMVSFPLRVDLFEKLITLELEREEPTEAFGPFGIMELPLMTEEDAKQLRDLISNINHRTTVSHPVQNIVNEDVQGFFAGMRSAEDTARIIQSRVQIFLDERQQ